MNNTDSSSVVARYIEQKLSNNMDKLGIKAVYYGEQTMVPVSPVVIVQPGNKNRQLAGVSAPGGRTDNFMIVYVDVLSSRVGSESDIRLLTDQLSERVEKLLHTDVTMEGLVIHGFVNDWDPGVTYLQNGMYRTVRLIWVGRSKTYLSA